MTEIPLAIVLPAFNRQVKLERALGSLLVQDVRPQQVIVVDDGSDPPLTVSSHVRSLLPVLVLRRPENGGAAAARNTGVAAAKTEWVTFLDSDDALEPGTLGTRWSAIFKVKHIQERKKTIYGCAWVDVDEQGRVLAERRPHPSSRRADFAGGCWFAPGSCVLIHRDAALAAVGPQDEQLRRFEDFDWFLRLGLAGFAYRVDRALVGARIERTRTQDPEAVSRIAKQLWSKWKGAHIDFSLKRRVFSYLCLERAAALYHAGAVSQAALWALVSLSTAPRLSLQLSPAWDVTPLKTDER